MLSLPKGSSSCSWTSVGRVCLKASRSYCLCGLRGGSGEFELGLSVGAGRMREVVGKASTPGGNPSLSIELKRVEGSLLRLELLSPRKKEVSLGRVVDAVEVVDMLGSH